MERLIARAPRLRATMPYIPLGTYPTPIERVPGLDLWVKRDDRSGDPWGMSKVRKLEHYFGEARAAGARRVATVGPLGSNHALATAIYGRQLGFEVLLDLWPEPVRPAVREAVLAEVALGAKLALLGSMGEEALLALAENRPADASTYFIPPAGTDAVGATGYVECGLEIAAREEPRELDFVHVAGGTGGVAAGLAVGLEIARAASGAARAPIVVAVRAVAKEILSEARLVILAKRIADRINALAGEVVIATPPGRDRFKILHAHAGGGYAVPTEEGERAAEAWAKAGLTLDPTYTAKAAAGATAFARSAEGVGRTHAFLLTYAVPRIAGLVARADPGELPRAFGELLT